MLLLLTSPAVIAPQGTAIPDVVQSLRRAQAAGNPTGVVSNHPKPAWYAPAFPDGRIPYLQVVGRQNGEIVRLNAKNFKLQAQDTIVLATSPEDVQMAKNGGAVLIAAGWSSDPKVLASGVKVSTPAELDEVLALTASWDGGWWFEGQGNRYSVRALADLSSLYKSPSQVDFGHRITDVVKKGGPRLTALLTIAARSLLKSGFGSTDNLLWGVFPSSKSGNDDKEVLSDFTHRLRTTVSKVRLAKRGKPLFIRHHFSSKRSSGASVSRTDPKEQVETLHLNPEYRDKIAGRHVVVVDDCTTYGLSFGVATGFLRAAGAVAVSGVALGKFGDQLRDYEVDVKSDPFAPVGPTGYVSTQPVVFSGTTNGTAQHLLRSLI
jgi:hypothetical protein